VRIARAAAWALLASMVLLIGTGMVLWGEGYRLYAVRTGSMTPTYPTGSLVVDRPVPSGTTPTVGQVITFRTAAGLVTHRLAARTSAGLHTKGDANRSQDPWTLPARNVVGEVVGGVPGGGYLLVFLHQPTGVPSLVLLTLSVLLAWQVFFGLPAAATDQPRHHRHRRRRPSSPLAASMTLGVVLLALGAGAFSSCWVGVRSTGAYFTDSVSGTMIFEPGCEDTHDHGNGPENGNGHQNCHGNGHTKDQPAAADPAPTP
jgi:signal peptidase I